MCEALRELFKDELEEAHEKGKSDGLSEGISKGENRLKELYARLEQDGRREDIFQALSNPEVLQTLYKKYGLE